MTKLLCQTDSYLKEFDAEIIRVDAESRALILDQTAFFPGGGGQPCDFGLLTVNGTEYPVTKVKKKGADALHFIGGEADLPEVGETIHGVIDWKHRYQLMRTHTAMHVLCGVVFRDYGALVTGGNMNPLKGRMDFEFETMRKELVEEIEEAVNAEAEKGYEVKIAILPREEAFQIPDLIRTKINLLPEGINEIRTIELVGLDLQADGGTHVHNTSEVGKLRVTNYKSKGKINKRIYVELE
ncbi:MAG: alanyl-tRNA editing protein [Anaerolineae bacterium]|jgi:misacylated tRNA(Ala) deacylase|nr:alanyl-tRNA editing protein [Anaerolineae bacterium]MBT3713001.1 alanyl-tRNA editing protein [Anaerolineae bacterium]MBT4309457.1 alanyl-tRNA editing protein [Anaerolineae bacterium]MBT4458267.1 alanyl-tRNA editing protein [Anaerolineae bacterium]MBT4840978.1 alanyl-tRNA editing protein [Anaerolineae bacterium]